MKTRVGILLGVTPHMGGVYQYTRCLLDAFASLPDDAFEKVAAWNSPGWADEVAARGMKGFALPAPAWSLGLGTALTWSGFPVGAWKRISAAIDPAARRLRREGCDVWVVSAFSFVCYQMPVPAVGIVHDLMHRYERRFRGDFGAGVYAWRERVFKRMCRATRALLVDSELGRRQLVESYGADPSRVHPLPYIPAPAAHEPPSPDFDARYRLPPRFFFYPAQFWEHKNHGRLLEALAAVRRTCPDAALVLAGAKSRRYEECRRRAEELGLGGSVCFAGYVPDRDMREFYRRAVALVMPTFFGPTNMPPLEAFTLDCPVAVSGIYAMPEQVGDAALLFDPNSVDSIAEAMRRLWTDDGLRADLVRRGRERARQWGSAAFNARFAQIMGALTADPRRANTPGRQAVPG